MSIKLMASFDYDYNVFPAEWTSTLIISQTLNYTLRPMAKGKKNHLLQ